MRQNKKMTLLVLCVAIGMVPIIFFMNKPRDNKYYSVNWSNAGFIEGKGQYFCNIEGKCMNNSSKQADWRCVIIVLSPQPAGIRIVSDNNKKTIFIANEMTVVYNYEKCVIFSDNENRYRIVRYPLDSSEHAEFNNIPLGESEIYTAWKNMQKEIDKSNIIAVPVCPCPTVDQRPENEGGNAETGEKMNGDPDGKIAEKDSEQK